MRKKLAALRRAISNSPEVLNGTMIQIGRVAVVKYLGGNGSATVRRNFKLIIEFDQQGSTRGEFIPHNGSGLKKAFGFTNARQFIGQLIATEVDRNYNNNHIYSVAPIPIGAVILKSVKRTATFFNIWDDINQRYLKGL